MAKNGFKLMDSDMHIIEPVDLWQRYIDPAFKDRAPREIRTIVRDVLALEEHTADNRLTALSVFVRDLDSRDSPTLLELAESVHNGRVLAGILREIGKRPEVLGDQLLLTQLTSEHAVVRAAAVRSLTAASRSREFFLKWAQKSVKPT